MKKALLFSEYFPPHWTGIAKAFYQLSRDLTELGYKVAVMTTQVDKSWPRNDRLDGISIIRVPYLFRLSRSHYSPLTIFFAIKEILHTDVVYINSPHSNILPLAILTKIFNKKLIIFHEGDLTLPKMTGNQFVNRVIEKIFDSMTYVACFLADTISTYTQDYAQSSRVYRHFMKKFIPYIPHTTLSTQKPSITFKHELDNLKNSHVLIGFAGRFVEEKGFDILLQTVPFVTKQIPNALFVFAGSTTMDYEPFFKKIAEPLYIRYKKNVRLLGLLKENDLAYFHMTNDVFVISSRSDCFPLTQMEAARAHTPLVVTDIPGARMVVASSGCGEIANADNPQDLSRAIVTVLKHSSTYRKHLKKALHFLDSYAKPPIY